MELTEDNYLQHYGILRKSGRYPWGSGENPLQRSRTFLDILDEHRKAGLSESKIAQLYHDPPDYPFTTTDLRAVKSRAVNMRNRDQIRTAQSLKDKGMGNSEIGRQMGVNESTVRSLLEPGRLEKLDILESTANMLKKEVEEKGFVDVGAHVELDLPIGDNPDVRVGISKDKFLTALSLLKEEGYQVHPLRLQQVGTGEFTNYRVLTKKGVTQKDVFLNRDKIELISHKSDDGGRTYQALAIKPPLHIDPKRVGIRYKEDGGADADGVIYVRPGVSDLSLGKSHYAQVRIAVRGDHYLKGMAIYKDDLPPGVDLMFNTNKSDTGNKFDAMKPMKIDKDGNINTVNPFGAAIKLGGQLVDKDGNVISVMNRINDEGDWSTWSRNLSRQVLSKQSPDLAKSQLAITYERRRNEYEKIKALTNPTVKKKLLESFSNDTDAAAVHLKAANMPGQATRVILPVTSMKPHEIFAPSFKDGDRVALLRFPHAGTFEIPELTVNNRNREARKLFAIGSGGKAPDAVGIHPKVAEHLSGADFDGDHVVVVPNNRTSIKSTRPLDGLKGFDPQEYKVPLGPVTKKYPKGTPIITDSKKQTEMGKITNLISDMTIRGANTDELARAVRHSMVVIDSEKHNLDYKASANQNGILDLKRRYQMTTDKGQLRGASTLITRATARKDVPKRKARLAADGGPIDLATGEKRFVPTGERDKRGKLKTFRSKKLAETNDAFTLVSENRGTPMEREYAEHSNRLKALANEARLLRVHTQNKKMSPSAKEVYRHEVAQLDSKLNHALKNAPRERQAQVVANMIVSQRRQANPEMEAAEKKKIKGQALDEARLRTGAKKDRIEITPREWEAIQAGAISSSKLEKILNNTDIDAVKKLATPIENKVMTNVMTTRAKTMLNSGYTIAEVADALGIAPSTLESSVGGGE